MDSVMNATGPMAAAYSGGASFGYPEGMSVVDTVPDHMKHMVHSHWKQFPPVNPMWHYLLGVVYLFLGAISIFGNGMVLLLFCKTKNLKTPANYLVANVALSDMCMMLSQFPFFAYNCFSGGVWMFSAQFCEIYACLGSITGLCSIWSLVFVSYDRYNVIVNGVSGSPMSVGKAMVFIMFSWGYGIAWSIPPFLGWGRYIPEGILDSCSFDYLTRDMNLRLFGICIFIFDYCIPLAIIIFSYMFIVKAIVAHEKAMREQAKKMNVTNLRSNAEANAQSAEVRIAKVAMTNVALWLICWTPYAAVVVQGLFFNQAAITPLVSMLPALLAKSASVYNPVIYAINHPKFRLALMKQMPGFCIHEDDPDKSSSDNKSTETQKA